MMIFFTIFTIFFGSNVFASNPAYYKIKSIDSNAPISDFASLSSLINGAKVVGLGEPIHGSHGFHQARLKFIQYLVVNENFRAIGFESSWKMALETEQYIQTCQEDRKKALMGLQFIAWMDESILELLDWLCQYNQEHLNNRVFLFGFDIQNPRGDKTTIKDFFSKVDPDYSALLIAQIDTCLDITSQNGTLQIVNSCKQAISNAEAQILKNQSTYERASSKAEVFYAKTALLSLSSFQIEQLYARSTNIDELKQGFESRDMGMAETFLNFKKYFNNPKTIIYAHNYHIATHSQELTGAYKSESMGTILEKKLATNYAAIGSIGYDVKINQKFFKWANPPLPTNKDSVELGLHQKGLSYALINSQSTLFVPGKTYLLQDQGFGSFTIIPSRHYSALFFIDKSDPLVYEGL